MEEETEIKEVNSQQRHTQACKTENFPYPSTYS